MKSYHIVALKKRIGTVRELPNGLWKWHGLGRSGRLLESEKAALSAAKRAFGDVTFEEVYEEV